MRGASILVATMATTALVAGTAVGAETAAERRPIAVVELFTSQGCGRCPPADQFLGELAHEKGVVALSYAVDYWDYMGWKDTAARPEFARRQKGYADRRGDHDVFTPQMVVNGRARLVGSDRDAVRREISLGAEARHDLSVAVEVETVGDAVRVHVPDADLGEAVHATVWLVRFDETRSVTIRRGENNGRTITYSNVVRSLLPIGVWKGRDAVIEVPRQETPGEAAAGCAVIVQSDREGLPGRIFGAAACARPQS